MCLKSSHFNSYYSYKTDKLVELLKPVILILVASYVSCQRGRYLDEGDLPPIPEKCEGKTDALYKNCCVFPPFFTREVAKECGGVMEMLFVDQKNNVTGFRRRAYNCDHWICVLDRYGLLAKYGDLDDEKYYAHLDLWVRLNPVFSDAMLEAKVFCKEAIRPYLPLKPCEFYNLHGCIRNFLNVECPVVIPTQECQELKEFYKQCKDYYHKK